MGHICYYATAKGGSEKAVFTGDTLVRPPTTPPNCMTTICVTAPSTAHPRHRPLFQEQFIGGAGKFFEGSPADMYGSLYGKLAALPPDTAVWCGHEVRTRCGCCGGCGWGGIWVCRKRGVVGMACTLKGDRIGHMLSV